MSEEKNVKIGQYINSEREVANAEKLVINHKKSKDLKNRRKVRVYIFINWFYLTTITINLWNDFDSSFTKLARWENYKNELHITKREE